VISREHAYLDLVEVLEEAVEDGQQVRGGELATQDARELVQRVRERAAHLVRVRARVSLYLS
jgi:hypothetical protein